MPPVGDWNPCTLPRPLHNPCNPAPFSQRYPLPLSISLRNGLGGATLRALGKGLSGFTLTPRCRPQARKPRTSREAHVTEQVTKKAACLNREGASQRYFEDPPTPAMLVYEDPRRTPPPRSAGQSHSQKSTLIPLWRRPVQGLPANLQAGKNSCMALQAKETLAKPCKEGNQRRCATKTPNIFLLNICCRKYIASLGATPSAYHPVSPIMGMSI